MFRWVILAQGPLSTEDLRYAIAISLRGFSLVESLENSPVVQKLAETNDRVRKYSGGLLEVSSGIVQVIHQSVKEFPVSQDHTRARELRTDETVGHTRLAETCIAFLCFPGFPDMASIPRSSRGYGVPLLGYAIHGWTFHSNRSNLRDSRHTNIFRQFLRGLKGPYLRYLTYIGRASGRVSDPDLRHPFIILAFMRVACFNLPQTSSQVHNYFGDIPNFCQNCFLTAIKLCARTEVEFCIQQGADVNAPVVGGMTPLLTAINSPVCRLKGELEIVELLVRDGADVNARSDKCGSVLQAAVSNRLDTVQFLIKNGADVNVRGGQFDTILQVAACGGKLDIVQFLIKNGADVNAQGGLYGGALQAATVSVVVKLDTVQFLVENGADPGPTPRAACMAMPYKQLHPGVS